MWLLITTFAKYSNPFYILLFYHQNLWHSTRTICWYSICHFFDLHDTYNFIARIYWIINIFCFYKSMLHYWVYIYNRMKYGLPMFWYHLVWPCPMKYFYTYVFCFTQTLIVVDKSSTAFHLCSLITNGFKLRSAGFKSIRVGLTIHGSLFKDRYLVAKEPLKLIRQ